MLGTSSWRVPSGLARSIASPRLIVGVVDHRRLAVEHGEGVVHRRVLDEGAHHGVADEVGERDLAAPAAGEVVVDHRAVVHEQLRRHGAHAGRGGDREAGLHVVDDAGGGPAQDDGLRLARGRRWPAARSSRERRGWRRRAVRRRWRGSVGGARRLRGSGCGAGRGGAAGAAGSPAGSRAGSSRAACSPRRTPTRPGRRSSDRRGTARRSRRRATRWGRMPPAGSRAIPRPRQVLSRRMRTGAARSGSPA